MNSLKAGDWVRTASGDEGSCEGSWNGARPADLDVQDCTCASRADETAVSDELAAAPLSALRKSSAGMRHRVVGAVVRTVAVRRMPRSSPISPT